MKNLCCTRYEKNHLLDVAKKWVGMYSSSNAAAQYPKDQVN